MPDAFAHAALPPEACLRSFVLHRQDNCDQIALQMDRFGWRSVEDPLPAHIFRIAHRTPGLIIDVGANTGFYTMLAAAASARNRILAFEPVPEIIDLLHRNVLANGLQDRIRLIRCALSNRNGSGTLHMPTDEHGLIETSASLEADFKATHAVPLTVLCRTLDRVMARPALFRQRVRLIKIDAEGHDAAVLEGARWTIWRDRPIIFVEIMPAADMDAVTAFLRRHRYRDVPLRPGIGLQAADEVAFDPHAHNHALVPNETLSDFLRAAHELARR